MGKHITDFSSVATVGLDLAKHVFQVHAIDASGRVIAALSAHARQAAGVFRLAAALPRRARCLRFGALLGARVDRARSMTAQCFEFDWDPAKARRNAARHGLLFNDALTIFVDPLAKTLFDTHAEIDGQRVAVRIISARPATKREARQYREGEAS